MCGAVEGEVSVRYQALQQDVEIWSGVVPFYVVRRRRIRSVHLAAVIYASGSPVRWTTSRGEVNRLRGCSSASRRTIEVLRRNADVGVEFFWTLLRCARLVARPEAVETRLTCAGYCDHLQRSTLMLELFCVGVEAAPARMPKLATVCGK